MRVLLTNENFDGLGGTETYVVAVAAALARLGHEVTVYSPNRGVVAEQTRASGIPVVSRDAQPRGCDLVLAGDAATAAEMATDQPDAVRLFVAHSAQHLLQAPPLQADVVHGVVALNDRVGRAVQARGSHAPLIRLRQPIDLGRFWNLGPVRSTPRVALVNSNAVVGTRAAMLERACGDAGLELIWIGGRNPHATPETVIAGADLVIGLGRSALEGMAAGRPTFIHGVVGTDGWVTVDRYAEMESDGFAGLSRRDVTFDVAALTDELRRWDPELGEVSRDLASAHHAAEEHAQSLVAIARTQRSDATGRAGALEEISHLVRMQRATDSDLHNTRLELRRLHDAIDDGHREAEALRLECARLRDEALLLHTALAASEERYAALRATRRVKLALGVGARLDRARSRATRLTPP
jgi:hypothetical protein